MITQDIALFSLLLPAIPLNMVAVNFRYTALAGLIRQIHGMAQKPTDHDRPPAVLLREVHLLQTRITCVKFSLFFGGLSFLFNLLAVGLLVLGAKTVSYVFFRRHIGLPVICHFAVFVRNQPLNRSFVFAYL